MNLILRPSTNLDDPVWSVIICVILAVAGAFYCIYYILGIAFAELEDGRTDTTKQEELLQLPSDGDQSCP
jgi:hypothetical protein